MSIGGRSERCGLEAKWLSVLPQILICDVICGLEAIMGAPSPLSEQEKIEEIPIDIGMDSGYWIVKQSMESLIFI